ncbi:pilus assembly FimT family protein [Orenia marismortui]|uniref:General secretion pathway protein H n=1 Tax=Orenia marismortui TaxID=46469 RepID=A0A4R8HBR8_9FIRM|nr:prepilin-type N-terminal cleavage/methylation domain-containing protein [Orenia marismortui]TDX53279.1 general secretion pathway protein H [Orenia marismortui]
MKILLTGKEKGFTLLEVLISIVLITLIIGIVLPAFDILFDSVTGKTTERKVINLFAKIRNKAITSNSKQSILVVDDTLIYQGDNGEKIKFNKAIKRITVNNKKEDSSEGKMIHFFPNGTSSGASLNFVMNNDREFELVIDKVTGRTEVGE